MSTSFFGSHSELPTKLIAKTSIATLSGPRGRFSHSASLLLDEYQPAWLVFGGCLANGKPTDELALLDLGSVHWSTISNAGEVPSPRYSHATAVVNRTLYLFGGTDESSQSLEDVYMLDMDSRSWKCISATGEIPTARSGHTLSAVGNVIVLFGGSDSQDATNDLYILNLDTYEWKKIEAEVAPAPRYFHTITVVDKTLYMFGGRSMDYVYNDLWKLTLGVMGATWDLIEGIGEVPFERFSHASCLVGNRIFVTCGRNSLGEPAADIHAFHIPTGEWEHIQTDHILPACDSHTAIGYKDRILIYGGKNARGALRSDLYSIALISDTPLPTRTPVKSFSLPTPVPQPAIVNPFDGGKELPTPILPIPSYNLPRRSEPKIDVDHDAPTPQPPQTPTPDNLTLKNANLFPVMWFFVGGLVGFYLRGLVDEGSFSGIRQFFNETVYPDAGAKIEPPTQL